MINTDKYEEFENAMNEGRIERVHCLWALAEVKRLRAATQQIIGNIELWCKGDTVPKDILMENLKGMIE